MDCIFSKIITGEIPSYTYYEDDIVKVFLDINPSNNGHSLIVPKKYFKDIYDIDLDTLTHINKISKNISKFLTYKLNCDGITFMQNNGCAQDIKYYHLHIIPKYNNKQAIIEVEKIYDILKNDTNN